MDLTQVLLKKIEIIAVAKALTPVIEALNAEAHERARVLCYQYLSEFEDVLAELTQPKKGE